MPVTIYHNPRCSKSRQALELLESRDMKPVIVRYLETPPDVTALQQLAGKLGLGARELLRTNEAPYRELGLDDPDKPEEEIYAAMSAHPVLIQRPIVVAGNKARIGRPPESILEILE